MCIMQSKMMPFVIKVYRGCYSCKVPMTSVWPKPSMNEHVILFHSSTYPCMHVRVYYGVYGRLGACIRTIICIHADWIYTAVNQINQD